MAMKFGVWLGCWVPHLELNAFAGRTYVGTARTPWAEYPTPAEALAAVSPGAILPGAWGTE